MFVQSNLEKKEEGVPQIRTEPQSHITFMCNSNHTVGILKILMEPAPDRNNRDQYEFSFKTTNKANYRVSEPQGLLLKSPHILYVHLKGVGSLQDTLKDKFKLTIIDKKKMQTIFTAKLGIIIESSLSRNKEESTDANVSKINSIYTAPSILHEGNSLRTSSLFHSMTAQASKVQFRRQDLPTKLREQIKEAVNDSIHELESRKRTLIEMERDIQTKEARSRFVIYLLFFVIILAFIFGLHVGKSVGDQGISGIVNKFYKKIIKLF